MILLLVTLIQLSSSAELNLTNAVQSSDYSSSFRAFRAIDGSTSTQSITKSETNPWLTINFANMSYVEKVVIEKGYSYSTTCTYEVYVEDTNTGMSIQCGSYDSKYSYYYNVNVNCDGELGHRVTLRRTGCSENINIYEMKAYGETACDPGQNKTENRCTECPENTYSTNGTQCTQCDPPKESSRGSRYESDCTYTSCNPGYSWRDNRCIECPENTYSTNGTQCTQCDAPKESSRGSRYESDCTYGAAADLDCRAGQEEDRERGECRDCDRDYYEYDNTCYQCPDDKKTIYEQSTYDDCLESRYVTCDSGTCKWVDCPCYDYELCSGDGKCVISIDDNGYSSSRMFSLDAAVFIAGITLLLY